MNFQEIFSKIRQLPLAGQILSLIAIILIVIISIFFLSSCTVAKTITEVVSSADGVHTTITQTTTGGATSVQVSPAFSVDSTTLILK